MSTNLAWKRLQIYTDLLLIIRSTADELYGGTNMEDLERPWTPKIGVLVSFSRFQPATHFKSELRRNYFKRMLTRVSWALAQISSCFVIGQSYIIRLCYFCRNITKKIWNKHIRTATTSRLCVCTVPCKNYQRRPVYSIKYEIFTWKSNCHNVWTNRPHYQSYSLKCRPSMYLILTQAHNDNGTDRLPRRWHSAADQTKHAAIRRRFRSATSSIGDWWATLRT